MSEQEKEIEDLKKLLKISNDQNKSLKEKLKESEEEMILTIKTFKSVFDTLGFNVDEIKEGGEGDFLGKLPGILSGLMIRPRKFVQKFTELENLIPLIEKYNHLIK